MWHSNYVAFTVDGCADPELPEDAWMKRDAHEAVVGCRNTLNHVTWLLTCREDGQWDGPYVTCSSSKSVPPASAQVPAVGPASVLRDHIVPAPSLARPAIQGNKQSSAT